MSASFQQVAAEPVQGAAPVASYVMPDMFASPGLTMVPGQLQYAAPTVTYAAAPSVTYAAPSVTYAAPSAGSVVYAAPQAGSVTYAAAEPAGSVTYAAPMQTMTYAAPATYAAPVGGQPVFTISPERFQRIMAGEPLTNEEIAEMTGQAAAPAVALGTQAGQSFAMPDMFASPGLTMVGGTQGEFSQPAAAVTTIEPAAAVEPAAVEPAPAAKSDKKKKSDKKSSKKKLSSKKKSKGCC